jgi:hypothetical protein
MVDAKIDEVLRAAIRKKRLVKLTYQGKSRIIEPHDYGVYKGAVRLLSYQVAGASHGPLPNWRWMEVDGISGIGLLDRTFRGGRPKAAGKHHTWDELYLRVDPPEEEDDDDD